MAAFRFSAVVVLLAATAAAQTPSSFRIKYVAEGVVYIEGGRGAGLAEKMKMTVRRNAADVAELEILSVADSSAVCGIKSSTAPLQSGDVAWLATEDAQKSQILLAAGSGTHYAQTITFSQGDPVDEEEREFMPHPQLPEVNRLRGRIGLEYDGITDKNGSGANSSNMGVVLRADMTRIGGSYWNLSGYTRLRSTSTTSQQQTLNDLLNRTYTFALTYNNPRSSWTAGFGRFYLPWAPSLNTIDGGYVARRFSGHLTAGMFAGTTPDPTSWNYAPGRQMAGTFLNFAGGSFEGFHYTSTTGVAITRLNWKPEREFLFFENSFSFQRYFSAYHDIEVDRTHPTQQQPTASGTSVARSFLTVRFEPSKLLSFDLNHNYFRDFPTFDPRLVGTGLLDKLLFQGVSGGVRVSLPYRASVYLNLGRSNSSSDTKPSWNQLYGFAVTDILGTGIRTDLHYSHFNSSFGHGNYKSLSFSRQFGDLFRCELQAGQQNFLSPVTSQTSARYINANLDWMFSARYFLGGGFTVYHGQSQNYNQMFLTVGYRFGK